MKDAALKATYIEIQHVQLKYLELNWFFHQGKIGAISLGVNSNQRNSTQILIENGPWPALPGSWWFLVKWVKGCEKVYGFTLCFTPVPLTNMGAFPEKKKSPIACVYVKKLTSILVLLKGLLSRNTLNFSTRIHFKFIQNE